MSSPRASRASSIVSTRTKTSITTIDDDAQDGGVDVHVGPDAIYRIGLNGCVKYITRTGELSFAQRHRDQERPPSRTMSSALELGSPFPPTDEHPATSASPTPTATSIPDPSFFLLTGNDAAPTTGEASTVTRTPSFTPGRESISVQRRRDSSHDAPVSPMSPDPAPPTPSRALRLQRRGGVKLKVVTRTSSGHAVTRVSPLTPNSAESYYTTTSQTSASTIQGQITAPDSPTYIGRAAPGVFPSGPGLRELGQDAEAAGASTRETGDGPPPRLRVHESAAYIDEAPIGSRSPPAMDTENDISIHYSRLVRSIDSSHRKVVQAKDQEISEAHEMVSALARQVMELKAEVLQMKAQAQAPAEPELGRIRQVARTETVEAYSFSFPPLQMGHIRTLKMALKRRAERLRRDIDTGLGWSPRGSFSTIKPDAPTMVEETATTAATMVIEGATARRGSRPAVWDMDDPRVAAAKRADLLRSFNESERKERAAQRTELLRSLEESEREERAATQRAELLQSLQENEAKERVTKRAELLRSFNESELKERAAYLRHRLWKSRAREGTSHG
ncbi:MAG: hypothetical protein M1838_004726 [Thelocarpon superellum]|nr:MAG: hypothetical protein M1838_004726 [Thelocarpon superellum]